MVTFGRYIWERLCNSSIFRYIFAWLWWKLPSKLLSFWFKVALLTLLSPTRNFTNFSDKGIEWKSQVSALMKCEFSMKIISSVEAFLFTTLATQNCLPERVVNLSYLSLSALKQQRWSKTACLANGCDENSSKCNFHFLIVVWRTSH